MNEPPVHAAICLWFKRMLSILACGFVAERTRELLGGHDAIVEREHLVAHELIVLVALARDEDRVARLRLRDGARDGGATVGLHFEAAGSSVRGLSDVTTAWSAARAALPMMGRLLASRSPPQPNTQTVRPGVSAMMDASAFSSASGVWA